LLVALFDNRKENKVRREENKRADPTMAFRADFERDRGYNQQAGLSMIDDDMNPGMRGGFGPGGSGAAMGPNGGRRPNAIDSFPTLQSVNVPMTPLPDLPDLPSAPPGAGGMSLSAISGLVKPTDNDDVKKMKAARDLSLQKAATNRMGIMGGSGGGGGGRKELPTYPVGEGGAATGEVTEGQIERNKR